MACKVRQCNWRCLECIGGELDPGADRCGANGRGTPGTSQGAGNGAAQDASGGGAAEGIDSPIQMKTLKSTLMYQEMKRRIQWRMSLVAMAFLI
jgi:hypothetical protein